MQIVQCYFSLNIEPIPDRGTLEALFGLTAGNLHYPVGRATSTRQLHRALVSEASIAIANQQLTAMGKAPIICGMFDRNGDVIPDSEYNKAERDLYFTPYTVTDPESGESISVTPSDNVASGWGMPKWV